MTTLLDCFEGRQAGLLIWLAARANLDNFIDVIAIDALKRAQLESDPRRLDTRQDHLTETFGAGVLRVANNKRVVVEELTAAGLKIAPDDSG
jgi:hypothetical protein